MNRQEAIAALTSLPTITAIARADVKPNDVIVVECDAPLSPSATERLKVLMESVWPGRKVLVCEQGLRIKVLTETQG